MKEPILNGFIEQGVDVLTVMIQSNGTAIENYDDDLSDKVTFTLKEDLTTSGTKLIAFSVKDTQGNRAQAIASISIKIIFIKAKTAPYLVGAETLSTKVRVPMDYIPLV